MKLRFLTAALALVLAVTGLSACTTKVGLAATINGKRVTDSDLVSYLTPKAAAVVTQDANGAKLSIPARSFVLQTIIQDRFAEAVLHGLVGKIAGKIPTEAQIQAQIQLDLKGKTPQQILVDPQVNIIGYTNAFADIWVHSVVLGGMLQTLSQSTSAVQTVVSSLKFHVVVSPAYGSWDPKRYQLKSGPTDGYPSYMKFPASATPGN